MRLRHVRASGSGLVVNAWESEEGLVAVHLGEVPPSARERGGFPVEGVEVETDAGDVSGLARALRAYLGGAPLAWSGSLDYRGVTDFQRSVYDVVRTIAHANVWTYATVARRIGRPQSVRAVGNSLHNNPYPLVVPCHRVVREGGGLGGFAGGVSLKRRLLELESGQTELEWDRGES